MSYLHTIPMPARVDHLEDLEELRRQQRGHTRWDQLHQPRVEIPLPPPPEEREDPSDYEAPRGVVVIELMV